VLRLAAVALAVALAAVGAGAVADAGSSRPAAYRFQQVLAVEAALFVHAAAPRSAPGRLYLVEQDGLVRVVTGKRLQKAPFLDLTKRVLMGDEQGLLSLAFHPRFATNRRFYVDYIDLANRTRVVEYRANAAGTAALPRTERVLLTVPQPGKHHKGGQLAFGPDGKLYVSFGDGECCDDPKDRAQDPRQLLGKIVRLDVARARPAPEIVALGLRNPWRMSFDRGSGDLYIADVGAGLWEEIDYLPRAAVGRLTNFGWDAWEARAVKEDKAPNPAGQLVFPIHAYDHADGSCSVTGGFVYRGKAVPAARGRYFFGDYCTGAVWSLRVRAGAAADLRREPFRIRDLTSFGEDAAGELYAVTYTGRVLKLVA